MTVKELKEALNQFPDNCIVMIPNTSWRLNSQNNPWTMVPALNVSQGVNEFDGLVLIDDYAEDDDDE